jgi:hypothetical protein
VPQKPQTAQELGKDIEMKTAVLLICAALSGCAELRWYSDHPQDFEQDRYACLQEAQQVYVAENATGGSVIGPGSYSGSAGMTLNPVLFNACMRARGYELRAAQ